MRGAMRYAYCALRATVPFMNSKMSDPLPSVELTARRSAETAPPCVEKTPLERYVPPQRPSLVGLSRTELGHALEGIGVPPAQHKMRVQQLWHWLYVRGATRFDQMTNVSKDLRTRL